jgi:hypothetical protein
LAINLRLAAACVEIWDLLDPVAPEQVFPVFEEILQVLEQQGQLKSFRSVSDTLLIALARVIEA